MGNPLPTLFSESTPAHKIRLKIPAQENMSQLVSSRLAKVAYYTDKFPGTILYLAS